MIKIMWRIGIDIKTHHESQYPIFDNIVESLNDNDAGYQFYFLGCLRRFR